MSNSVSSTSNIDISSLLQALTGSKSSGLNVADLVSAATYAARAPERQYQSQQTTLKNQNTLLGQVQSLTSSLYDDMSSLADPIGVLTSLSATSSQSSVVSASVSSGAVAGSHTITVSQLATTGSWYSNSVASATTALSAGSFDVAASGGNFTVTVGSGVNTLNDVVTYINNQNKGVTASVITDASGAKLSIVSTTSGAANDFTISNVSQTDGNPFMDFTHVAGQNASLTVDGIPISSATNTVTGVIAGVTLNLNSAPEQGKTVTANVTIAPNSSSISSAINGFVNHYNTLVSGINGQFKYDTSTGSSGALAGDTSVRNLQSDLLNAITYTSSNSGTIRSFRDLGVNMKDDGTLSVDSAKLNSALTNNKADVLKFFQGDSSNGFANVLKDRLNLYSSSTDGAFTVEIKNNTQQIDDLQDDINDVERYVAQQQSVWTQKYSEAASALMSVQTRIDQINAMLGNDKD